MRISRIEYLLLLVIVLGALGVRLYKIDNPVADWHSWRQADTASVSRSFVQDGIDMLHPRYHDISSVPTGFNNPEGWRFVELPLFNALHAWFAKTFAFWSLERWGRTIAVFASLASTVLLYFIGKRFLGVAGGILSAFFFAFLPFNIYFSRVILPEPLIVAVALLSLWFFILWIDRDSFWFWLLSALSFALALLLKPYAIFFAVPMVYLSWEKFGLKSLINLRLWMFLSLSLIPVFFWRAWMNNFLEGIPHWLWAFNGDNIRFKPSWWWWIFEERLGRLILGVWTIAPFAVGFLHQKQKDFPWFLHSMFFGQFLYFATVATASVRHDYYQTLAIPAIALLLASGTKTLWEIKVGHDTVRRLVVLGCIVLGLSFSAYQIKEFYKINHPEILIAGAAVDRLLPQGAKVIASYNGDTAFLYQTKRRGWPHATLPMSEMVERLGAEYYVSVNFDPQTKEVMEQYQVLDKTEQYVIVKLQ